MKFKCGYNLSFFFLLLLFAAVSECASPHSREDNNIDTEFEAFLNPLFESVFEEKEEIQEDKDDQIGKLIQMLDYKDPESKDTLVADLQEKSSSDKESVIDSLKAQIDQNTLAISELKAQIALFRDVKHQAELEVEEQAMNCMPFENSTDIHKINVLNYGQFEVLCDGQTDGPGWTVVQRRFDGSVDFYRNWSEYRDGFGTLEGEFFMGLEKLYHITKSLPYELYIKLVDFNDVVAHARYDNFLIGSEQEHYMLKSLGVYSGNAGDALSYNRLDRFTTYDRDHDRWAGGNCAKYYSSAGWYNLYGNSNLNGVYQDRELYSQQSIWWYSWKGYRGLKSVQMMIRPKYSSF